MSDKPNISQILAALGKPSPHPDELLALFLTAGMTAAQRPGGTPTQSQPLPQQPPPHQVPLQQPPRQAYPSPYSPAGPPAGAPPGATPYPLPTPSNSGSIDLSNVKPVHSGSVSLSDAVTRARSIAAEKGFSQNGLRAGGSESIVFLLFPHLPFSSMLLLSRMLRKLTEALNF